MPVVGKKTPGGQPEVVLAPPRPVALLCIFADSIWPAAWVAGENKGGCDQPVRGQRSQTFTPP
jgi:hypothetical protein